ncbi:hypothetical protein ACIP4Y_14600 [Streptomyces sp. NPDC088810]|uniref:hypothetical protein n=1 Tax=Streptomyces sp. NPDC088810 TaxID=3365904 RepID=UPI003804D8D8
MAYDPIEPDAIEDIDDLDAEAVQERDVEAPEVDAAEQAADIAPERDDPLTGMDPDRGNVADLVEQARVVSLDEDDYR